MAVPDTNTFSLEDVRNELGLGSTTDLVACFAASVDSSFDATYKGSKNSLYNFRNYAKIPVRSVLGRLYNWYAANDANIAISGWRVPTWDDINTLAQYVQPGATPNNNVVGKELKESGDAFWNNLNTGTNSTGLTVRGTGYREDSDGEFYGLYEDSHFWTLPERTSELGVSAGFKDWIDQMTYFYGGAGYSASKKNGFCIRLIKEDSVNPGTITDYDGNPYDCVTIGSQVWIVQNWQCTRLNNGVSIPNVTDNTTWIGLTTLARCTYDNDENNV